MADNTRKYINILLDDKTLKHIDDYRFKNRFASRTEAVRHLIVRGLKSGDPVKYTKDDSA